MDWDAMQAGVYGMLNWTPAIFWELSMSEYYAAMNGITAINEAKTEAVAQNSGKLSKDEADELRQLLEEKG